MTLRLPLKALREGHEAAGEGVGGYERMTRWTPYVRLTWLLLDLQLFRLFLALLKQLVDAL